MAAAASEVRAGVMPLSLPSERADRFFYKVIEQLGKNDLARAIEILRSGNTSIHPNLTEKNINQMVPDLSDSAATPHATQVLRLDRMTKLMQMLFPDVFTLLFVKNVGKKAGYSQVEVEKAVHEVVLDSGEKFWVIGVLHGDESASGNKNHIKNRIWENSLCSAAARNQLNCRMESLRRDSDYENLEVANLKQGVSVRGQLRGLESTQSEHWRQAVLFYLSLYNLPETTASFSTKCPPFQAWGKSELLVRKYLFNCVTNPLFFQSLEKTAKGGSKVAKMLLDIIKDAPNPRDFDRVQKWVIEPTLSILSKIQDRKEWVLFLEELLPIVFADCTVEVQMATQEVIAASKKYKEMVLLNEKALDLFNMFTFTASLSHLMSQCMTQSGWGAATTRLVEELRRPSDLIFARSFCSEWPTRNKDLITVVYLGKNHVPGFIREVRVVLNRKAESKEPSAEDKKAADDRKG